MKAEKLLKITFPLVLLLAFAGCQGQETIIPQSNPNTENQTANITVEEKKISEADQSAYQGALTLNDASYCDKIIDREYQNQCRTAVADAKQLEAALAGKDASVCGNLSTPDKRESCKIQVDVAIKTAEEQTKKQQDLADAQKVTASGDYARCSKEIKDKDLVDNCEYNILANEAVQKKDVTLCGKITEKTYKDKCEQNYKDSVTAQ